MHLRCKRCVELFDVNDVMDLTTYELYRKDAVSLGKEYEIASLDTRDERGFAREGGLCGYVHTTPVEIETMAREAIKRSGR